MLRKLVRYELKKQLSGSFFVILLVLLLGGGGGLGTLLGGGGSDYTYETSPNYAYEATTANDSLPQLSGDLFEMLLGNLGGGAVSTGWHSADNTETLDTSVAKGTREKYTDILGGGRDKVTLMLYLCGTDLESRSQMATRDLQEMLNAEIGKNVNLIVYTGGCKQWQNNVLSSKTNQIWQVTG